MASIVRVYHGRGIVHHAGTRACCEDRNPLRGVILARADDHPATAGKVHSRLIAYNRPVDRNRLATIVVFIQACSQRDSAIIVERADFYADCTCPESVNAAADIDGNGARGMGTIMTGIDTMTALAIGRNGSIQCRDIDFIGETAPDFKFRASLP